jgi:membrane protein implicated in regulation of membrane protease activity
MLQTPGMARRAPSTFAKYLMLEAPGWVLAAVVLAFFARRGDLAPTTAALLLAIFVIKDFALYPLLKGAYEDGDPAGTASLVGAVGTAQKRLDPEGYVRVGSELWRAVVAREQAPVETGAPVRVLEVRGLTLHVEPV